MVKPHRLRSRWCSRASATCKPLPHSLKIIDGSSRIAWRAIFLSRSLDSRFLGEARSQTNKLKN